MLLSKDINLNIGVYMKRLSVLLSAAALSSVLIATGLQAQPRDGEGENRHHRMFADLNLSEKQKGDLKTLHQEMQELRLRHTESVKAVRDKMKTELLKSDASQNVLYGYAGELGELHKQMSKDRSDHLLKVKKVLTPEQFSKLVEREDRMGPDGPGCAKGHGKGQCCPEKGGAGCPHMGEKSSPPPGGCPHMKGEGKPPLRPAGCPHYGGHAPDQAP